MIWDELKVTRVGTKTHYCDWGDQTAAMLGGSASLGKTYSLFENALKVALIINPV